PDSVRLGGLAGHCVLAVGASRAKKFELLSRQIRLEGGSQRLIVADGRAGQSSGAPLSGGAFSASGAVAGNMNAVWRKGVAWFAGICAVLALAGCASSRGGSIPYDVADFGEPDAISTITLDENYQIAPLDKLSVNVFQVPDLTGEYSVDLTGHIAMPLIGSVRAVDLTTAQLQQELYRKLNETYLRNPDVTVGVISSSGSSITVAGSVSRPGVFPVPGRITLIQS